MKRICDQWDLLGTLTQSRKNALDVVKKEQNAQIYSHIILYLTITFTMNKNQHQLPIKSKENLKLTHKTMLNKSGQNRHVLVNKRKKTHVCFPQFFQKFGLSKLSLMWLLAVELHVLPFQAVSWDLKLSKSTYSIFEENRFKF